MIVIYHKNCSDGFCAAWLLHKCYPEAKFVAADYPDDTAWLLPACIGQHVIIADFSYSEEMLRKLATVAKEVIVLDHHEKATYVLGLIEDGVVNGVFDMKRSGAMITFDYLENEGYTFDYKVYEIVEYVQDRDLWTWKLDSSRDVNAALRSYNMSFSEWDRLPSINDLVVEGRAINAYKKILVDEHVGKAKLGRLPGRSELVPIVICTSYEMVSDIGEILCQGLPYACILIPSFNSDGVDGYRVSLRSDGATNVNEVCKTFGGGGHPRAAAFFLPLASPLDKWF